MKSMLRQLLSVKKRLLVLSMLMLVVSANLMAQSATQSQKEKNDSEEEFQKALTIEEVMEIAEEEIERTAQEAVKAALLEVGGELAFEKERAEELEKQNALLAAENKKLKEDVQKKQDSFFYGALVGGAGGVLLCSLIFSLIGGIK